MQKNPSSAGEAYYLIIICKAQRLQLMLTLECWTGHGQLVAASKEPSAFIPKLGRNDAEEREGEAFTSTFGLDLKPLYSWNNNETLSYRIACMMKGNTGEHVFFLDYIGAYNNRSQHILLRVINLLQIEHILDTCSSMICSWLGVLHVYSMQSFSKRVLNSHW